MNMWGFTPAAVPLLARDFHHFVEECGTDLKAESYLPKAVNRMVSEGQARVDVLHTGDTWCGVTYPQDHPHVVAAIAALTQAGTYPETLWP